MSQKRPANKSDSEPAHKKQMAVEMNQKVNNPQHIIYYIENKATLTFPAFCEKFDLFRRDYAYSRYKNIISKYLPDDCDRLIKEFNLWKSSFASKQFWLQKTRLAVDLDAHLSSAKYVQKVIQQEIQVLHDVNCSTSVRVSSHDTNHRSTSPSIDDSTTSITSNFDNQETNDWQESANTPVLADSVLNFNCFVATDNENFTDDLASADMTRHNDADLLDLPGHQTSSTLLSHANASAGWMFKGTNISTLTPAIVKTTKTKTPSYTIIGAIHASSIIHVAIKKPPPKKEKLQSNKASTSKKRKVAKGKKHTVDGFIIEEPATEYVDDNNESSAQDSSESISKGTITAHFIKFMNVLLDIMDLNEDLKGNYLVMDNCTIHKSKPMMMRKIESRGYKLMYLPPYSPELNPIEQFWAILKGKLKCHKLLNEEKMSDRIAEACNAIPAEILYNFASHSKRQIIQCYNKTPF
jgi:hypothetical protein